MFYYADEFNLSWLPTVRAMLSPKGQQVMIPTPKQPDKYYGIGAVNYHTGETLVLFRRRKRRQEIAELLQALVDKHPTGTIYVAWDNADTHEDDEVEEVVRAATGRLALLYLPTYSPGSIPLRCCGDIFAGKSRIASCLKQSKHCWQRPRIFLTATISAQKRFCR